jgi:predicted nucleic acid-binding protein
VSEDAPAVPTPWVLDISVLAEVARGDTRIMTLVQELDARGRPLVIPALAVTGASLDIRSDEAAELLEGLERLKNAMTAALRDAEQAVRLAAVIARTGLGPWDAHVAAVADAAVCPILTLDAARWREHAADLDEPLHFIEVTDPDEAPGGPGPGALGARSSTRSRHLSYLLPSFLHRAGVIPTSATRSGGEVGTTEAAPAGRISPGSRPDRTRRRAHSAACPVPPLRAGYAAGQPGMPAGQRLEPAAMAERRIMRGPRWRAWSAGRAARAARRCRVRRTSAGNSRRPARVPNSAWPGAWPARPAR